MSSAYKLMGSLGAEVSLEDGLSAALKDGTLHDVTLVGSDGVQVLTHRLLLVARSKVFKTMLMGSFSEVTSPTVNVDFPGAVVNAIVEYIYTSKVQLLTELNPDNVEVSGDISEAGLEEFEMLISMTAAAAYYNLPYLCDSANNLMETYVKKFPSLSLAVLEACAQEYPAVSNNLLEMALSHIRQNKFERLNEGILCSLSSPVLSVILSDEKTEVGEYERFEMVQQWSEGGSGGVNRKVSAKTLVKEHLKLHLICPNVLAKSVAPSGLADIEQMTEAYKKHALRVSYSTFGHFCGELILRQSKPVWNGSQSNTITETRSGVYWKSDKMTCPPLVNGCKYMWAICTSGTKAADDIMIGVAKHSTTLNDNNYCGSQPTCWAAYGDNGHAWYSGAQKEFIGDGAKFGNGSHVTVTLDLSHDEANNGSFSISVNGAASVIVSRNMQTHLDSITDGYVPVVSCFSGSSAKILSIEELV
ncbi:BACK [Seminavis robusta]|uniref:BACK n=1 Tax=Seminavis robusta TaxID=568900 RepID=A0A9N8F1I6_9STRA|nr:BACK [Seminavis robusta]|eukprot:Sro2533_g330460.1 BACK (473) ;mRNA; r:688-2106